MRRSYIKSLVADGEKFMMQFRTTEEGKQLMDQATDLLLQVWCVWFGGVCVCVCARACVVSHSPHLVRRSNAPPPKLSGPPPLCQPVGHAGVCARLHATVAPVSPRFAAARRRTPPRFDVPQDSKIPPECTP